jgi:hypothetical protein
MPLREPTGPDLSGVLADANAVGLEYVVIGGFSVIYHGYIRATIDSDLLVPDGPEADSAVLRFLERVQGRRLHDQKALTAEEIAVAENLRIDSRHGIVDIIHGGLPPLDYETVSAAALEFDLGGKPGRVASLPSVVGFKRLAGRPQDQVDLHELEALYGDLPVDPIPGLDA